MAATRPRVMGKGWLRRAGVPVVGVWLALLVALVASAGGAQAAAATRTAPFTVDTNLKVASGFNADELNAFVKKYEASSPLAKYGTYFVQAEQKSGVNAQGLLAIAIDETSWGTAGAAKDNNFFAIKGKKYSSASAGILDGAAWINTNYLTKGGAYYVSPTLKGMAVHYTTSSGWAAQVATIADRMRGAAAAPAPTATPRAPAPTPCPPSSRTCKPAPAPTQAPQPQPSCVPAMKPQNGGAAATMALPCNPTPNGSSANAGGNGNGPNDAPAQGGVSLPPEGSDGGSGDTASPAATAQNGGDAGSQGGSQGTSQGGSSQGGSPQGASQSGSQSGSQATPASSNSPASAGITMAGSVRRVAQSGGALVPLLAGLLLLIGGLVAVVIARRRPTF